MTPDLSRRLACALHALSSTGVLDLEKRQRLAREAEPCNSVEELPVWIQDLYWRGVAEARRRWPNEPPIDVKRETARA